MAVSGICSGVPQETPGKSQENRQNNFSRVVKCFKFWDFGHVVLPGLAGSHGGFFFQYSGPKL